MAVVTTGLQQFPPPYLQPNRHEDCGYYATAYLCHCLGHPDVTADQVKMWRAETRYHESRYPQRVLGAEMRTFSDVRDESRRKRYWLGPDLQGWLTGVLFCGWRGIAQVNRIQPMGHAVTVLAAGPDGVLLMDPIYGHVTESWDWFLGPGPKDGRADWPGTAPDGREWFGAHYIEGWYAPAGSSLPQPA